MDVGLLVRKTKQGDQEALVQLIMSQKKDYYKLAYVYMKNEQDALDAIEDMIVIVYENINKLRKEELFYSWSKTILVNCCRKQLKKRKRLIPIDSIEEATCEGGFLEKEEQIILDKHLSSLNEKHREVLRLRYFLDFDNQTIAELLNIPLGTVKSRISIGLKSLKASIGGEI